MTVTGSRIHSGLSFVADGRTEFRSSGGLERG
jgi:hypothetical protein